MSTVLNFLGEAAPAKELRSLIENWISQCSLDTIFSRHDPSGGGGKAGQYKGTIINDIYNLF